MGLAWHIPILYNIWLFHRCRILQLLFRCRGIGAFEVMFSKMYVEGGYDAGSGLAVALGFRLVTIINALIGVIYYFSSKKEIEALSPSVEEG